MAAKTRRRTSTALVYNPARRLSIGGAKQNPRRRRRRRAAATTRRRRRNPVSIMRRAAPRRRSNPIRRRRNPSTTSGLAVAAIMAGIGVSIFDVLATRVIPNSSSIVRAGVKLGGAWLFQSRLGSKVPVLGKYKNDIALVLAVAGVVDLMKLYVFPLVAQTASSFGLLAPGQQLIAIDDGTTSGIYGNAYAPEFQPYA